MDKELEKLWKNKISTENFAKVEAGLNELAAEIPASSSFKSAIKFNYLRLAPALCLSTLLFFIFSGAVKNTLPDSSMDLPVSLEQKDTSAEDLALLFDDSKLFEDLENINVNLMEIL